MNKADIITIIIVSVVFILALKKIISDKKKGICTGCALASQGCSKSCSKGSSFEKAYKDHREQCKKAQSN